MTQNNDNQLAPGLDPLIGAMFTQMFDDRTYVENQITEGYERQIQVLSKALVELYNTVMNDPNLTVRMMYKVEKAAGGAVDGAVRTVGSGYYSDKTYRDRHPSKDQDSY